jgi:hypothetical protein
LIRLAGRESDDIAALALAWAVSGDIGMDRSSSEYSHNENEAPRPPSFEETYPRYEFAELVRIGLVLAEWLAAGAGWRAKMGRRMQGARFGTSSRLPRGEIHPAE